MRHGFKPDSILYRTQFVVTCNMWSSDEFLKRFWHLINYDISWNKEVWPALSIPAIDRARLQYNDIFTRNKLAITRFVNSCFFYFEFIFILSAAFKKIVEKSSIFVSFVQEIFDELLNLMKIIPRPFIFPTAHQDSNIDKTCLI